MPGSITSKIKYSLLKILRTLKVYRAYTHVPKGEVSLAQLTDVSILNSKEYPQVKRVAPATTEEKPYWKFERLMEDVPQKTFVLTANNWRVWGNQGAVITHEEYLLKDVSREFEKPDHSLFKQLKLAAPAVLKGTSAVIAASGDDMYYHWMYDILPRIMLLRDCGLTDSIDRYILNYRDLPFQKESMEALGISTGKISRANDHFNYHVLAESLVVPSLPSELDVVSADACRFLKDTFLDTGLTSKAGKKIYLKRTGKRRLINEAEIEPYLKDAGFETVICENYTVKEQASIFHNADVIIGPHGAAFTNVVFCRPGTKVIEFFSPRWINPCYWTICNEVSLPYYYLVGEGPPPDNTSDARGANADITLNIEKLKQLFKLFHLN